MLYHKNLATLISRPVKVFTSARRVKTIRKLLKVKSQVAENRWSESWLL
jgi:hypothetical protein